MFARGVWCLREVPDVNSAVHEHIGSFYLGSTRHYSTPRLWVDLLALEAFPSVSSALNLTILLSMFLWDPPQFSPELAAPPPQRTLAPLCEITRELS